MFTYGCGNSPESLSKWIMFAAIRLNSIGCLSISYLVYNEKIELKLLKDLTGFDNSLKNLLADNHVTKWL